MRSNFDDVMKQASSSHSTVEQGTDPMKIGAGMAGGAVSGGVAGAKIGSIFPGVGTAIGAVIGTVVGGASGGAAADGNQGAALLNKGLSVAGGFADKASKPTGTLAMDDFQLNSTDEARGISYDPLDALMFSMKK